MAARARAKRLISDVSSFSSPGSGCDASFIYKITGNEGGGQSTLGLLQTGQMGVQRLPILAGLPDPSVKNQDAGTTPGKVKTTKRTAFGAGGESGKNADSAGDSNKDSEADAQTDVQQILSEEGSEASWFLKQILLKEYVGGTLGLEDMVEKIQILMRESRIGVNLAPEAPPGQPTGLSSVLFLPDHHNLYLSALWEKWVKRTVRVPLLAKKMTSDYLKEASIRDVHHDLQQTELTPFRQLQSSILMALEVGAQLSSGARAGSDGLGDSEAGVTSVGSVKPTKSTVSLRFLEEVVLKEAITEGHPHLEAHIRNTMNRPGTPQDYRNLHTHPGILQLFTPLQARAIDFGRRKVPGYTRSGLQTAYATAVEFHRAGRGGFQAQKKWIGNFFQAVTTVTSMEQQQQAELNGPGSAGPGASAAPQQNQNGPPGGASSSAFQSMGKMLSQGLNPGFFSSVRDAMARPAQRLWLMHLLESVNGVGIGMEGFNALHAITEGWVRGSPEIRDSGLGEGERQTSLAFYQDFQLGLRSVVEHFFYTRDRRFTMAQLMGAQRGIEEEKHRARTVGTTYDGYVHRKVSDGSSGSASAGGTGDIVVPKIAVFNGMYNSVVRDLYYSGWTGSLGQEQEAAEHSAKKNEVSTTTTGDYDVTKSQKPKGVFKAETQVGSSNSANSGPEITSKESMISTSFNLPSAKKGRLTSLPNRNPEHYAQIPPSKVHTGKSAKSHSARNAKSNFNLEFPDSESHDSSNAGFNPLFHPTRVITSIPGHHPGIRFANKHNHREKKELEKKASQYPEMRSSMARVIERASDLSSIIQITSRIASYARLFRETAILHGWKPGHSKGDESENEGIATGSAIVSGDTSEFDEAGFWVTVVRKIIPNLAKDTRRIFRDVLRDVRCDRAGLIHPVEQEAHSGSHASPEKAFVGNGGDIAFNNNKKNAKTFNGKSNNGGDKTQRGMRHEAGNDVSSVSDMTTPGKNDFFNTTGIEGYQWGHGTSFYYDPRLNSPEENQGKPSGDPGNPNSLPKAHPLETHREKKSVLSDACVVQHLEESLLLLLVGSGGGVEPLLTGALGEGWLIQTQTLEDFQGQPNDLSTEEAGLGGTKVLRPLREAATGNSNTKSNAGKTAASESESEGGLSSMFSRMSLSNLWPFSSSSSGKSSDKFSNTAGPGTGSADEQIRQTMKEEKRTKLRAKRAAQKNANGGQEGYGGPDPRVGGRPGFQPKFMQDGSMAPQSVLHSHNTDYFTDLKYLGYGRHPHEFTHHIGPKMVKTRVPNKMLSPVEVLFQTLDAAVSISYDYERRYVPKIISMFELNQGGNMRIAFEALENGRKTGLGAGSSPPSPPPPPPATDSEKQSKQDQDNTVTASGYADKAESHASTKTVHGRAVHLHKGKTAAEVEADALRKPVRKPDVVFKPKQKSKKTDVVFKPKQKSKKTTRSSTDMEIQELVRTANGHVTVGETGKGWEEFVESQRRSDAEAAKNADNETTTTNFNSDTEASDTESEAEPDAKAASSEETASDSSATPTDPTNGESYRAITSNPLFTAMRTQYFNRLGATFQRLRNEVKVGDSVFAAFDLCSYQAKWGTSQAKWKSRRRGVAKRNWQHAKLLGRFRKAKRIGKAGRLEKMKRIRQRKMLRLRFGNTKVQKQGSRSGSVSPGSGSDTTKVTKKTPTEHLQKLNPYSFSEKELSTVIAHLEQFDPKKDQCTFCFNTGNTLPTDADAPIPGGSLSPGSGSVSGEPKDNSFGTLRKLQASRMSYERILKWEEGIQKRRHVIRVALDGKLKGDKQFLDPDYDPDYYIIRKLGPVTPSEGLYSEGDTLPDAEAGHPMAPNHPGAIAPKVISHPGQGAIPGHPIPPRPITVQELEQATGVENLTEVAPKTVQGIEKKIKEYIDYQLSLESLEEKHRGHGGPGVYNLNDAQVDDAQLQNQLAELQRRAETLEAKHDSLVTAADELEKRIESESAAADGDSEVTEDLDASPQKSDTGDSPGPDTPLHLDVSSKAAAEAAAEKLFSQLSQAPGSGIPVSFSEQLNDLTLSGSPPKATGTKDSAAAASTVSKAKPKLSPDNNIDNHTSTQSQRAKLKQPEDKVKAEAKPKPEPKPIRIPKDENQKAQEKHERKVWEIYKQQIREAKLGIRQLREYQDRDRTYLKLALGVDIEEQGWIPSKSKAIKDRNKNPVSQPDSESVVIDKAKQQLMSKAKISSPASVSKAQKTLQQGQEILRKPTGGSLKAEFDTGVNRELENLAQQMSPGERAAADQELAELAKKLNLNGNATEKNEAYSDQELKTLVRKNLKGITNLMADAEIAEMTRKSVMMDPNMDQEIQMDRVAGRELTELAQTLKLDASEKAAADAQVESLEKKMQAACIGCQTEIVFDNDHSGTDPHHARASSGESDDLVITDDTDDEDSGLGSDASVDAEGDSDSGESVMDTETSETDGEKESESFRAAKVLESQARKLDKEELEDSDLDYESLDEGFDLEDLDPDDSDYFLHPEDFYDLERYDLDDISCDVPKLSTGEVLEIRPAGEGPDRILPLSRSGTGSSGSSKDGENTGNTAGTASDAPDSLTMTHSGHRIPQSLIENERKSGSTTGVVTDVLSHIVTGMTINVIKPDTVSSFIGSSMARIQSNVDFYARLNFQNEHYHSGFNPRREVQIGSETGGEGRNWGKHTKNTRVERVPREEAPELNFLRRAHDEDRVDSIKWKTDDNPYSESAEAGSSSDSKSQGESQAWPPPTLIGKIRTLPSEIKALPGKVQHIGKGVHMDSGLDLGGVDGKNSFRAEERSAGSSRLILLVDFGEQHGGKQWVHHRDVGVARGQTVPFSLPEDHGVIPGSDFDDNDRIKAAKDRSLLETIIASKGIHRERNTVGRTLMRPLYLQEVNGAFPQGMRPQKPLSQSERDLQIGETTHKFLSAMQHSSFAPALATERALQLHVHETEIGIIAKLRRQITYGGLRSVFGPEVAPYLVRGLVKSIVKKSREEIEIPYPPDYSPTGAAAMGMDHRQSFSFHHPAEIQKENQQLQSVKNPVAKNTYSRGEEGTALQNTQGEDGVGIMIRRSGGQFKGDLESDVAPNFPKPGSFGSWKWTTGAPHAPHSSMGSSMGQSSSLDSNPGSPLDDHNFFKSEQDYKMARQSFSNTAPSLPGFLDPSKQKLHLDFRQMARLYGSLGNVGDRFDRVYRGIYDQWREVHWRNWKKQMRGKVPSKSSGSGPGAGSGTGSSRGGKGASSKLKIADRKSKSRNQKRSEQQRSPQSPVLQSLQSLTELNPETGKPVLGNSKLVDSANFALNVLQMEVEADRKAGINTEGSRRKEAHLKHILSKQKAEVEQTPGPGESRLESLSTSDNPGPSTSLMTPGNRRIPQSLANRIGGITMRTEDTNAKTGITTTRMDTVQTLKTPEEKHEFGRKIAAKTGGVYLPPELTDAIKDDAKRGRLGLPAYEAAVVASESQNSFKPEPDPKVSNEHNLTKDELTSNRTNPKSLLNQSRTGGASENPGSDNSNRHKTRTGKGRRARSESPQGSGDKGRSYSGFLSDTESSHRRTRQLPPWNYHSSDRYRTPAAFSVEDSKLPPEIFPTLDHALPPEVFGVHTNGAVHAAPLRDFSDVQNWKKSN